MLDRKEFIEEVTARIPEHFSGKYEGLTVAVEDVKKLTESYTGIHLVGRKISTMLDVDQWYDRYRNGTSLEEVICTMAHYLQVERKGITDFDMSNIEDYSKAKKNLFFRVLNKKDATDMLQKLPHREICDLVMLCSINVGIMSDGARASAPVNYMMLDAWGITEEQLMSDTEKNCMKNSPALIIDLHSFFGVKPADVPPMISVTNKEKMNGAAVMFYPGMLDKLSDMVGGPVVILPSSVHDVIATSITEENNEEKLKEAIEDANTNACGPGKVLSDHPYVYDPAYGQLENYSDYFRRKLS